MRTGFGIKNKTLEAMAAGTPVVGSDRGLEGIEVDGDGVPLCALRANRVDEYVEAISRLFASADLRATLSYNARAMIEKEYSWFNLAKGYEQVIIDS
jgi:glycosyltransferase involved in cell wall biosynthesis